MGIFNEHSSSSSFTTGGFRTVPLQGAAGPQGIGFKLTQNGNYDIQNKKLVNVKQGADPNDVVTKSQIQLLDNAPGDVRANKAVIYSNSGSVHTNSIYLQDTPDGAGSSNDVRLLTEHQSYENIHLNIPDLKNFDGHGGRAKSEIMVTSTEQHITGRKILGNPSDPNDASTKAYVDNEISKIPSVGSDLSVYLKKDGSVAMTGNLDMNNKQIKDMAQPTDDNDATTKKYFDDKLEQSHLVSSHKTNEFKYLTDTDESSSEYNITVNGIAAFNQSPHQNKKAYDITLIKDSGSNDYRSRIGFNIYTLAIGTYTIVFEFYPPEMTNIQLSCTASEAYIHKAVQRDFTAYSKLLVQFNNNSKQTPNYIYLTMHGTATATPVQCHLVVYGVKDWSDSVYPGVYDGLDNVMFEYKNGDMQIQVNLDMNNKIISGLINPIYDSEAMNLGYFTNLFKTKYTGTIASGVFQRTNLTNNFQIAADGNNFFNLYSIVFQSNQQVANAQILINGKKQGETTNTDTYHRIGNIISGSNTFALPKSMKFVSIDSMSILDSIGAGTAVNGTFELKVLYSDYFERYHTVNKSWLSNIETSSVVNGNIKNGVFENVHGFNFGTLGPVKIKNIVINTKNQYQFSFIAIANSKTLFSHLIQFNMKIGRNFVTTNTTIKPMIIQMGIYKRRQGFTSPIINREVRGTFEIYLSTLLI